MAVGEIVRDKSTWLMDDVEVVGAVYVIGADDFGIIPDDNYRHLIQYFRGNNPLPWDSVNAPGLLHCETYHLTPTNGSINPKAPTDGVRPIG